MQKLLEFCKNMPWKPTGNLLEICLVGFVDTLLQVTVNVGLGLILCFIHLLLNQVQFVLRLVFFSFLCILFFLAFSLGCVSLIVVTSAIYCLEQLVSKMIYLPACEIQPHPIRVSFPHMCEVVHALFTKHFLSHVAYRQGARTNFDAPYIKDAFLHQGLPFQSKKHKIYYLNPIFRQKTSNFVS